MLATHNANAARAGNRGGVAETIHKSKQEKFSRSAGGFQDHSAWLRQTLHWRDSLAARIADAKSRVIVDLHIDELHSIAAEVQAFKRHCSRAPSKGGAA